jgi:hypothetical protein
MPSRRAVLTRPTVTPVHYIQRKVLVFFASRSSLFVLVSLFLGRRGRLTAKLCSILAVQTSNFVFSLLNRGKVFFFEGPFVLALWFCELTSCRYFLPPYFCRLQESGNVRLPGSAADTAVRSCKVYKNSLYKWS